MCSHTALFCCCNCSQTLICLELKCSVWQRVLPGEEKQYVRRRRRKSSVNLVFIENRFGGSNHTQRQGFQCRDVHVCSFVFWMWIGIYANQVSSHGCDSAQLGECRENCPLEFSCNAVHLCNANEVSRSEAQQPVCRGPDLCEALSEVWSDEHTKVRVDIKVVY